MADGSLGSSTWSALRDRVRGSLFIVPLAFVLVAALLGELTLRLDAALETVPDLLATTVDSARAVLTVVASAILAFAGIAFSVALLLISQASSQYSPRVVHGLFRDPFTRRVLAIVLGTFTYCLVVLRAVRGPVDSGADAVIPSLSVFVALVLGIVAILATVAFISHTAHAMDVSEVLDRVTVEALAAVPAGAGPHVSPPDRRSVLPTHQGRVVRATDHGWVQRVDMDSLLESLPDATVVELLTAPGRYVVPGAPIARTWSAGKDAVSDVADVVRRAVRTGAARTLLEDPAYGVRQLADVALRALSPGINDATTARDALLHQATVLRALLCAPPTPEVVQREGRTVVRVAALTPTELVDLAFDEVRVAAGGTPDVLLDLLDVLEHLVEALPPSCAQAIAALHRQAALTVAAAELGEHLDADRDRVRRAHLRRFASR
jgi:uncharacterized membrane protein